MAYLLVLQIVLSAVPLALGQDPAPRPEAHRVPFVAGPWIQPKTPSPEEGRLIAEAEQYFRDQDWAKAARTYQTLTMKNPALPMAWFRLGYCLHVQGKLDDAIAAHEKAAEFPKLKGVALYNVGCAYALKGKPDFALGYLEKAVDAGFKDKEMLKSDPDLASLQKEPRFLRLLERACRPHDQSCYRQLDFLEGEWTVFDAASSSANPPRLGVSVIKKIENGYMLTEQWKSAGGYTGTHFFCFAPCERKWNLTWVSGQGELIRASGEFQGNVLTFEGKLASANDATPTQVAGRIELRADGKVRQTLRMSADGKQWRIYFDGLYVPSAKVK